MRLLLVKLGEDTEDHLDISLCEFLGSDIPPYAILSHRWRDEEVLYADMGAPDKTVVRDKKGYSKLEITCRLALSRGLEYVWSDTCCIDKTSSAELSEAINSMYNYYTESSWCIAYLDDVEMDPQDSEAMSGAGSILSQAAWFTRGWTLQELIAPNDLTFYTKTWNKIGTKAQSCKAISVASGIDEAVLKNRDEVESKGISERMSWAAQRETTRPEDQAYSLMGIFGVNMATLYGEGRSNAFRRLQTEIMQKSTDHTLFAWESDVVSGDMLAPNVSCFSDGANYQPSTFETILGAPYPRSYNHSSFQYTLRAQDMMPTYEMTNAGLRIQLPVRSMIVDAKLYFAFLACKNRKTPNLLVAICIRWYQGSREYPRFSREAFSKRALYTLESGIRRVETPVDFTSQPIWISNRKLIRPPPMTFAFAYQRSKKLRYQVWIKAKKPWPIVSKSRLSEEVSPSPEHLAPMISEGSGEIPHSTPKKFYSNKFKVQHVIRGSLSLRGFNHEVIALGESSGEHACIGFGVVDQLLWIRQASLSGSRAKPINFSFFTFPTGECWNNTFGGAPTIYPLRSTKVVAQELFKSQGWHGMNAAHFLIQFDMET